MKTGLNFQTCTIINSNKYYKDTTKDTFEAKNEHLIIRPGFNFEASNIQKVYQADGYEGEMAQIEIDLAKLKPAAKTYYRLDIYVKVQGAEPYIYATPWIQKGRPFWVEFSLPDGIATTGGTAKDATKLVDVINREHVFQVGDDQIKAKATCTKVTLTATADYLRFAKVEIVKLNDEGDDVEIVGTKQTEGSDLLIKEVTKGQAAFGTYSHIIKDLRLPTNENTRWLHLRQDETPVIGTIYDQYIIEYKAPANNRPLGAVGCVVDSYTTHVFWIKHELAASFKELLKGTLKKDITVVAKNCTTSTDAAASKASETSELSNNPVNK